MSVRLCTAEYMISDSNGIGPRRNWLPRVVAEAFLTSTKDGKIDRAPDPVTMIDGDLTWFNNSPDDQTVAVMVHRAPRFVVAQNPVTVAIHDAWSFDVGDAPSADVPSVNQDTFGGKMQIDRASVAADALKFGRFYLEGDDSQCWQPVGVVKSMQSLHFRYVCAVQTPGVWTRASEFDTRFEAEANWCRLQAWAAPVGES